MYPPDDKKETLFFSILMQKISDGVLILNDRGVIVDLNPSIEKLLGYDRKYIRGKTYMRFIVFEDLTKIRAVVDKLLIDKSVTKRIGRLHKHDGAIVEVEYHVNTTTVNGEQFFVVIINDITERTRMRNQTLLADKLATIGVLTAGVLHEINNPLSWILTNINYLNERLNFLNTELSHFPHKNNDPVMLDYLNDLQKELFSCHSIANETIIGLDQVRNMIRELKGYVRVDEANGSVIDIHEVIESAIKIASVQFKNNIKINKYFANNIPTTILARGRLQQVLLNIIVNAAQAFIDRNNIENIIQIHTKLVIDKIQVEIADNGPGINPEVLPKIFDPFFTTKSAESGTGLGLAICQEIIQNMGGDIRVYTELGKGTTFTLILPVKGAFQTVKEQPIKKNILQVQQANILVIDDEQTLLKTIDRILDNQHIITTTNNSQHALEILQQKNYKFDVIITDLNMPGLNGMELYQHIARDAPGLEKHIIFITGGTMDKRTNNFLNTVNNICLAKPFTKVELLQAIVNTTLIPY